jgi:hypothetical protein
MRSGYRKQIITSNREELVVERVAHASSLEAHPPMLVSAENVAIQTRTEGRQDLRSHASHT